MFKLHFIKFALTKEWQFFKSWVVRNVFLTYCLLRVKKLRLLSLLQTKLCEKFKMFWYTSLSRSRI